MFIRYNTPRMMYVCFSAKRCIDKHHTVLYNSATGVATVFNATALQGDVSVVELPKLGSVVKRGGACADQSDFGSF